MNVSRTQIEEAASWPPPDYLLAASWPPPAAVRILTSVTLGEEGQDQAVKVDSLIPR